jgi:neutral trehalase
MPRLEPDPPLLSSIPTPYDVVPGSPTSREPSLPQNAITPDVEVLSRSTNANRPGIKNGVKATPIYGPRTYASHISHQKELCKMKRKQKQMKMELAKATIDYRQKKLSNALDEEMCTAVNEYELSTSRKTQVTIDQCLPFYVASSTQHTSLNHSTSTAPIAVNESVNELKGASSVEDNGSSSSSQRKEPFTIPGLPR